MFVAFVCITSRKTIHRSCTPLTTPIPNVIWALLLRVRTVCPDMPILMAVVECGKEARPVQVVSRQPFAGAYIAKMGLPPLPPLPLLPKVPRPRWYPNPRPACAGLGVCFGTGDVVPRGSSPVASGVVPGPGGLLPGLEHVSAQRPLVEGSGDLRETLQVRRLHLSPCKFRLAELGAVRKFSTSLDFACMAFLLIDATLLDYVCFESPPRYQLGYASGLLHEYALSRATLPGPALRAALHAVSDTGPSRLAPLVVFAPPAPWPPRFIRRCSAPAGSPSKTS